jgi:ribonucleoside-diphosphate reductase alpha chain
VSPKSDAVPGSPAIHMNVRKRNGSLEPINLEKIVKAVTRSARGITDVDPARVPSPPDQVDLPPKKWGQIFSR